MSIKSMMTDYVSIITPTLTTDSRGSTVKVWTNAQEFATRAWMAQTNEAKPEDEMNDHREGTRSFWRCFLPYGSLLDNRCRIRYLGELYEVVGEVHTAKTPSGPHHLEVPLKKVKG